MGPCCSSRVSRALRNRWPHSGVAARRHLDPAAPENIIKQQAMQLFAESAESGLGSVGPAPQHHEASHGAPGSARPAQRWKKDEHHNESLAPPLLDIRRSTKACGENHSRALPMAHSSMRQRWKKKSHQMYWTSISMMTTRTMTAVAEAIVPFSTVESEERFLHLRLAYDKHPPKP